MNPILEHATGGHDLMIVPREALERFHDAAMKVSRSGDITFANARLCEIAGRRACEGLNIRDLVPDEATSRLIAEHLKTRLDDRVAETYRASLRRADDGTIVPVEIIAFPELDGTHTAIGSIAIVRDRSTEEISAAVHAALETSRDWRSMLAPVAAALRRIVPCDWFTVSLYSEDGSHIRELYSVADFDLPQWGVRWYALPEIVARFMAGQRVIAIPDLNAYLAQPELESVLRQPSTQMFLQLGLQSCLSCPVVRDGRTIASVSLYRRERGGFTDRHKQIVQSLPLPEMAMMAWFHLQREELGLRLRLMSEIAGAPGDTRAASQRLVETLRSHYQWDNVSFFRVDEFNQRFELVAESCADSAYTFGAGYTQALAEGILGQAYDTRKSVRSGNVGRDPQLGPRFRRKLAGETVSELTIPVIVNNKVCAVLNSEDKRENAYAHEEQVALEIILAEVATLFQRVELEQTLTTILESTSDTVIATDSNGVIRSVNGSAEKLLKCPTEKLVGSSVRDLIADPLLARGFLQAAAIPPTALALRGSDGADHHVLLAASPVKSDGGGRVYTVTDLALHQRVERLEALRETHREIAIQTQAPISLCFGWLHRLSLHKDASVADAAKKVAQQLKKAQITFDRLSMLDRDAGSIPCNLLPLGVDYLVSGVMREMPDWDAERVELTLPAGLPPVRADLFQLSFCLKSVLAYLLRFTPLDSAINVSAVAVGGEVTLELRGRLPAPPVQPGLDYAADALMAHARFELALNRPMVAKIMSVQDGRFEEQPGDETAFRFTLPAARWGEL